MYSVHVSSVHVPLKKTEIASHMPVYLFIILLIFGSLHILHFIQPSRAEPLAGSTVQELIGKLFFFFYWLYPFDASWLNVCLVSVGLSSTHRPNVGWLLLNGRCRLTFWLCVLGFNFCCQIFFIYFLHILALTITINPTHVFSESGHQQWQFCLTILAQGLGNATFGCVFTFLSGCTWGGAIHIFFFLGPPCDDFFGDRFSNETPAV